MAVYQANMPRDAEFVKWQESHRSWAREHPGYCPNCGLPRAYCYDQDPLYRSSRSRFSAPYEISRIVQEWHGRALRGIPDDVLVALPMPRSRIRAELVVSEIRRRALDKPPVRLSVWERLLRDPII